MGLIHNASTFHVLYPFWACALIYAYGGVVTMTACEFSDNEHILQYVSRTLPLFFWTGWLVVLLYFHHPQALKNTGSASVYALLVFFVLAMWNTCETVGAFYEASKSGHLPLQVEPIARYMREGRDVPCEGEGTYPLPMERYRYVVWGNPMEDNDFITTEEIWQLVGTRFLVDCAGRERLKDLCLSYAFFRLILRRFADFPLYESSEPKTRHFIQEGLLSMDIRRVFNIIEVELQFLFDFFYTKSYFCALYDFSETSRRVLCVFVLIFYSIYGMPLLISADKKDKGNLFSIQFHGHSLEVGVTRIVIFVFFLLELWKIFNMWFSNLNMVRLLCKACNTMEATDESTCWIDLIWNIKDWFSRTYVFRFIFKPWQRQLGQYSFLESSTQVPTPAHFVRIPKVGQSSIKLSMEVKQAIVTSLMQLIQEAHNDQPVRLCRGRATIARYLLHEEISCACQLETDAHVILVWHIATILCARHHHLQNNDPSFLVATQLSKYCAYLVNFSPELLPGHPFTTKRLAEVAVQQAKRVEDPDQVVKDVGEVVVENPMAKDPDEVVKMGYMLADRLMNESIFSPNLQQGWKFLAEFWAELLLYLAPSDKVAVHGEHLAKGGEFITHIWVLLTHAGVVTWSINCPPM